jgi:hypothetical protein
MSATPKSYDILLTTRSTWTGRIEAACPAEALDLARHIWHSQCPHPFERCGDDELETVSIDAPPPEEPPPRPDARHFLVTFRQRVRHSRLIEADDRDAAIEAATALYLAEDGLFPAVPPERWHSDFEPFEVVAEEVRP